MKFVIDIPDEVSYGNVGAFLRGWLAGFNRQTRRQNPYRNLFRRSAWQDGWEHGGVELKRESYRRNARHIQPSTAVGEAP